jgi:uncharacterized repeat protein (TIGR01451 family)
MRSTHFGYGLLAAAGLLSTSAVQGQVQQALDMTSNHSRSVSTIGVDIQDEPAVLAGAADPFSVARKTQDMNYGAPNNSSSPGDKNRTANSSAQPTNTTANDQSEPSDTGAQSISPSAASNGSQTSSAKSHLNGDGIDPTTSGPLKNLQQRLSAVRKSTTPGMASISEPHLPPSGAYNASVMTPAAAPTTDMTTSPSGIPTLAAPIGSAAPTGTVSPAMGPSIAARIPSVIASTKAPEVMPSMNPAASEISGPSQAPSPPTNVAVDETPDSSSLPETHSSQLSSSVADAIRSKTPPTRSSYPVVSLAVAPTTPAVSESSRPSRRSAAAAPSPDFNAAPMPDTGAHPAPSSYSIATTPEGVLFAHQSPVLEVETTGPRSVSVGKEANYCITISNTGELPAQNVEVSIKTPEWSEILRTKATNGETVGASNKRGEPLIWRLPRLESHAKEQLTVRLVPRESQSFDLVVQWTCSPAVSKTMVEVKEPKVALTLDGPSEILFGQTKVYRLTLANPGNGDAENVVLLLAPVDGGAGAPTRHEIGLIRAGETKPVEVELSARQAGKLSIKATAVADGNLKSEVAQDILVRRAGLKTAVTGPELKFAGTPVTYNVVVTNPGNCTAENISASAILPPSAKFVNSPGGQYVEEENKVTWTIPSLRAGAEQELQLTCTLNSPGTNRVQVLATAAGDLNDNVSTATNVEALADLKLEVVDPPGPLAVGEEMIYEVHIHNRGTKAAENVDVAGFFSNGIEPLNAQGAPSQIAPGQIVFKPIAAIAAGSEVVLRIKARADQAGNHVFRTEVNCPSVGAKLASEETTLFYGDGRTSEDRVASRSENSMAGQVIPASDSSAPAVAR